MMYGNGHQEYWVMMEHSKTLTYIHILICKTKWWHGKSKQPEKKTVLAAE